MNLHEKRNARRTAPRIAIKTVAMILGMPIADDFVSSHLKKDVVEDLCVTEQVVTTEEQVFDVLIMCLLLSHPCPSNEERHQPGRYAIRTRGGTTYDRANLRDEGSRDKEDENHGQGSCRDLHPKVEPP